MIDELTKRKYLREIVRRLRQKEAEKARGDLEKLDELEQIQDNILLRKWAWISTIYGAIFSFLLVPLLISVLQPFLPDFLNSCLWIIAKVSMAISLLMFGTAIYFTINENID